MTNYWRIMLSFIILLLALLLVAVLGFNARSLEESIGTIATIILLFAYSLGDPLFVLLIGVLVLIIFTVIWYVIYQILKKYDSDIKDFLGSLLGVLVEILKGLGI